MRNIIDADSAASSGLAKASEIFPVKNATIPYWRSELHPIDEHRSTKELPAQCDIAIIGAGLSGVSMAYHLAKLCGDKHQPSIVILEARQVCSGATGRNGGHVKMKSSTMQSLIPRHGIELASEVRNLVTEQIYALKDVVQSEGLDCEFELRRSYDVYIDEDEAVMAEKEFVASVNAGQEWTRDVDLVKGDMVEQVTSIKGAKVALSTSICSLWPYKFVSQVLARLVERAAVNLQTNTMVTKITQENDFNILQTPRGSLKARKVVFATNAYTAGILHSYHGKIVPTRGTASHITPANPVSPHLSHTYNIAYQRPSPNDKSRVDYLNPRPDGSIVVGGGKWLFDHDSSLWHNTVDDSTQIEEARPHFEGLMQRHFKGWEESGAELESIWTGIMGYTPDAIPHVGAVPGQEGSQWILAGFNGGGNSMIWLTAKGVAQMVLEGSNFEETGLPKLFKTTPERLRRGDGIQAPETRV